MGKEHAPVSTISVMKESITIEAQQIQTQDLLSDLAAMWRPPLSIQ